MKKGSQGWSRLWLVLLIIVALFACVQAAHAKIRPAEVGGQRTDLPQLVDITFWQGGTEYACSGAVIGPDVVLTAAHCAGGHDYFVSNRMRGGWSARPPVVAPGYSAAAGYVNDLAVLQVDVNLDVRPLPVASAEPAAGTPAVSYGWGETHQLTGDGGVSPRQLGFVIESAAWCGFYWGSQMVSSDMCASSPGSIADGDSGGPLVANGQVVGVNDEAADAVIYPSIFTRTDLLSGWIRSEVKALSVEQHVQAARGLARRGARPIYGSVPRRPLRRHRPTSGSGTASGRG